MYDLVCPCLSSPLHSLCCPSFCQSQGVFFQKELEANPVGHCPAVRLVPKQWTPEDLAQQEGHQESRPEVLTANLDVIVVCKEHDPHGRIPGGEELC